MGIDFTLLGIFAPHDTRRRNDLINNGRKLIHYTSAAAAISIIRNKHVWMRNVRCMNDYMEVEHGFQLMQRAYHRPVESEAEKGFIVTCKALDDIYPDLSKECISWFDSWLFQLRNKTYVTCLSEHSPDENEFGRLSMWRSYTSNQAGVGLIINPIPLYNVTETFGAFSSPVHYFDDSQLHDLFVDISKNIEINTSYIQAAGRDEIKNYFCTLLRGIAMCTKHPGFVEEKEWRIMHTELLDATGALELNVECINGIPQPIYKIPLNDQLDMGMTGIELSSILEKVLIGPTQFPIPVWDAISHELKKAGVEDVDSKVAYSNIPLRT